MRQTDKIQKNMAIFSEAEYSDLVATRGNLFVCRKRLSKLKGS